ncbi:stress responsive alpha-beta barrel domain-containing [Trichoderma arundinaceum]|uniref:Stress responsive alpha-beta barrel domain-containing n=1 Tax=Trichoderma arundinaceum TaxID=490622 RepID=A0A395NKV0_TRIAR|nr:stress responsive alpha-beta barrel domain-containing [Trichoderma arundinaceum]
MSITHIVQFAFKADASAEDLQKIAAGFLALKDQCLHATTQKPYIQSLTGGKNNSTEGFNNGLTHAFVVHFNSAEDRDYYVNHDPAHRNFVVIAKPLLEKISVLDYTPGVF